VWLTVRACCTDGSVGQHAAAAQPPGRRQGSGAVAAAAAAVGLLAAALIAAIALSSDALRLPVIMSQAASTQQLPVRHLQRCASASGRGCYLSGLRASLGRLPASCPSCPHAVSPFVCRWLPWPCLMGWFAHAHADAGDTIYDNHHGSGPHNERRNWGGNVRSGRAGGRYSEPCLDPSICIPSTTHCSNIGIDGGR
jgi:hypothetical protein